MAEFVMPKLGLTMESGTIVEWLAADGTPVTAGQAVLVIETDKVNTDVEAPTDGVLHHAGSVGDSFACGDVIGFLLAEGEVPPSRAATAPPAPAGTAADAQPSTTVASPRPGTPDAGGRLRVAPNARRVAAELGIPLTSVRGSGPGGRIVSEDVEEHAARRAAEPTAPPRPSAGVWAASDESLTPPATVAARQLADLLGVDLRVVAPSSGDGRRSREDVAAYVRQQLAARADAPATGSVPTPTPLLQTPASVVPLTGMRGVIAERMHASLRDMAQLTLHLDASMDAVVADRVARTERGSAPGFTDYVIAAVARALREHPIVNSQLTEEGIALLPGVHVGMAVAVDGGLLVPVVRDADHLDLDALAAETRRLADAARAKRLPLADLEGGTFSVTALGMFGVDGFTPVINAPNAAILGVGRVRDEVRIVDGAPTTAKVATLSLTWDHRVLDGAPAAEFAARVAALLGDPAALDRPV